MRKAKRSKTQPGGQVTGVYPWAAPTRGWFDNHSIANSPDDAAVRLDNFTPETNNVRVRPGFDGHSSVTGLRPIRTIMVYQAGGIATIFAAVGGDLYDVTTQDLTAAPFRQTHWPNPRGHPPRQYHVDRFKLTLTTVRPAGRQLNWPNPAGKRRLLSSNAQGSQ